MEQFKRAKVVMLPTGESNLSINRSYKERGISVEVGKPYLTYCKTFKYYSSVTDNSCNPQHLYIISDDTFVKKGEWYYDRFSKTIQQCTSLSYQSNVVRKIIATTDTSLGLPQPSQQFIEKYIEEYNKGNIITDVKVEYYREEYCSEENYTVLPDRWRWVLKINPKDNTITIKKVKDNWSREEVVKLLNKLTDDWNDYNKVIVLNEWIEENL